MYHMHFPSLKVNILVYYNSFEQQFHGVRSGLQVCMKTKYVCHGLIIRRVIINKSGSFPLSCIFDFHFSKQFLT